MESKGEITALLDQAHGGDQDARSRLMEVVYLELRRLAASKLTQERRDHTLQPSALVNEAYLRMVEPESGWQNRAHFFAMAANTMRNVLVDYARSRRAHRRNGGRRVDLSAADVGFSVNQDNLIMLDKALNEMAKYNSNHARVVELHFFGGMTFEEIAGVMKISPRTAKRYWELARSWLQRYMRENGNDSR